MTNYSLSIDITPQQVCDQIVTAFEGGSNYWLGNADLAPESPRPVRMGKPWYATAALYEMVGWKIICTTDDEDGNQPYTLNRAAVTKTLAMLVANHQQMLHEIMSETGDAETADVFLQLALFGEIVYG